MGFACSVVGDAGARDVQRLSRAGWSRVGLLRGGRPSAARASGLSEVSCWIQLESSDVWRMYSCFLPFLAFAALYRSFVDNLIHFDVAFPEIHEL